MRASSTAIILIALSLSYGEGTPGGERSPGANECSAGDLPPVEMVGLPGRVITSAESDSQAPALIKEVLDERLSGKWTVSVEGLELQKAKEWPQYRERDLLIYAVEQAPSSDAYYYTIYLYPETGEYFVLRSGGYFNEWNIFGPGFLNSKVAEQDASGNADKPRT